MEPRGSEDSARQRLDQLIRLTPGESYSSVSALIGRNHAYIQQYIRRGQPRRLREEDRRRIAAHFGVSDSELGGQQTARDDPGFAETTDGLVFIPRFGGQAGVRLSRLSARETAESFVPFRQSLLRRLTRSSPDKLTLLPVSGDSMYPTLSDGDDILVDQEETTPRRDAVYAIGIEDAVQVKRVSVNPITGRLTIKSDNPLYESWNDCDPEHVVIIGRVIWAGRRL